MSRFILQLKTQRLGAMKKSNWDKLSQTLFNNLIFANAGVNEIKSAIKQIKAVKMSQQGTRKGTKERGNLLNQLPIKLMKKVDGTLIVKMQRKSNKLNKRTATKISKRDMNSIIKGATNAGLKISKSVLKNLMYRYLNGSDYVEDQDKNIEQLLLEHSITGPIIESMGGYDNAIINYPEQVERLINDYLGGDLV